MAIPEPLVTIRRYSSSEPAVDDCRLLIDAGIDAYIRTYRRQDVGEVRVPESQVERALGLLPPPLPDLVEEPSIPKVCPWCGSDRARYPAPVSRLASIGGIFAAALLAVYRNFQAAALVFAVTLWVVYLAKINAGLVCANCGGEWRAPRAAPEPEPEPEREQGTEAEHEPGTENPEE